jgi:hypothetical protein
MSKSLRALAGPERREPAPGAHAVLTQPHRATLVREVIATPVKMTL